MLGKLLGFRSYASLGGQAVRKEQKRRAPVSLILASCLCVLVAFFELFIVFFEVVLADADKFPGSTRTAYTTGISILATLIAFFITGQIRKASTRWLDYRLATENGASYGSIDMAWKANLGFLSLKERALTLSTWPTQLLYVVTGLLAVGFISATTPTDAAATTTYGSWIPKGSDCSCAGTILKQPGDGQPTGWSTGEATWSISDSANFAATNRTDSTRCALSQMPGLMNAVNNKSPSKIAYSVDGIAVQGSAVGAPEILFSNFYNTNVSSAYRSILADKGRNLQSVSQCAPVLKKNPFKCQPDPKGSTKVDQVGQSNFGTFSTTTDGCSYSKWYNGDLINGTLAQLMQGQFCPGGSVGAGTLVIGGYSNAAVNLALMVGDMDWANQNWQNAQGYTVRCEVDVAAAIGWRQVSLNLRNRVTTDAPYAQFVSGGEDCPSQPLDAAYAATAAGVAGKSITDENEDIYFPKTLIAKSLNATGNHPAMYKAAPIAPSAGMMRTGPWALAGSGNGLEDTLGVTAGIVMSKMIAQNFTGNEDAGTVATSADNGKTFSFKSDSGEATLPMLNLTGTAATSVVRMGPGETFAVIYAVPALLAGLVSIFFIVRTPWHREARQSSSLLDIMAIGKDSSILGEVQMRPGGAPINNSNNNGPVVGSQYATGGAAGLMDTTTAYKEDQHAWDVHVDEQDEYEGEVLEKPKTTALSSQRISRRTVKEG